MAKNSLLARNEASERDHFDKMAQLYDTNYTYNTGFTQYKIQKKLANLFKHIPRQKKLRILEIGAGTGEYTQHLAAFFPNAEIIAIDISPQILAVAQKKCAHYQNVKFQVASVYDLPFAEYSFDLVCGFYILHHLDMLTAMTEVSRVLRSRGKALFYEPNILNPVVLAIKSIPVLKKAAGDSVDEWAINPLTLNSYRNLFSRIWWQTTEFVSISASVPYQLALKLDYITTQLGSLPFLNLFGGSVSIKLEK